MAALTVKGGTIYEADGIPLITRHEAPEIWPALVAVATAGEDDVRTVADVVAARLAPGIGGEGEEDGGA